MMASAFATLVLGAVENLKRYKLLQHLLIFREHFAPRGEPKGWFDCICMICTVEKHWLNLDVEHYF